MRRLSACAAGIGRKWGPAPWDLLAGVNPRCACAYLERKICAILVLRIRSIENLWYEAAERLMPFKSLHITQVVHTLAGSYHPGVLRSAEHQVPGF
jgi:hypothetical protein